MSNKLWLTIPLSLWCAMVHADVTVASPAPTNTLLATAAATNKATAPSTASSSLAAVSAVSAAAATSTAAPKKEEAPTLKAKLDLGASYGTQAQTQPDGTRSESLSYSISPTFSYSEYSLNIYSQIGYDLKDTSAKTEFTDPAFGFSKKAWVLNDYLKLGPGLNATLPTSDNSRNVNELLYNVGVSLNLSLETAKLGLDKWSTSYYLGYNKNFTRFSTNTKGEILTQQRIRQRFNLGYQITDKLSFFTRFQLDSAYSAEGVVRNSFLHFQDLGYDITDNLNVTFEHALSNSLLNSTTYENNLKFYDEASSEYSISLGLTI